MGCFKLKRHPIFVYINKKLEHLKEIMKVMKFNVDAVYAVGDMHGNFNSILYIIRRYELSNCLIIFCGDIGMGFESINYYKQVFNKLSKLLSKRNVYIVFVRGNHDDKRYFDENPFKFKYIKLIPDYTVISTMTHNILCVGGGVSVDRTYRLSENEQSIKHYIMHHGGSREEAILLAKRCYWENEMPVFDEEALDKLKKRKIEIDTVCSHTCPSFAKPFDKEGIRGWLMVDEKLDEDLTAERATMDKLFDKLIADGHPLKDWIYGHFHFYNREIGKEGVMFTLLDMERNGILNMIEVRKRED